MEPDGRDESAGEKENAKVKITLSGKSTFKGKNGYQKLAAVEAMVLDDAETPLHIDFFGKRQAKEEANIGTARLVLTRDDAMVLKKWFSALDIERIEA